MSATFPFVRLCLCHWIFVCHRLLIRVCHFLFVLNLHSRWLVSNSWLKLSAFVFQSLTICGTISVNLQCKFCAYVVFFREMKLIYFKGWAERTAACSKTCAAYSDKMLSGKNPKCSRTNQLRSTYYRLSPKFYLAVKYVQSEKWEWRKLA